MVKITLQQAKEYFQAHKYSTYKDMANYFGVCEELLRKKFKNEIVSSLNHKAKYIALKDNLSFDSCGIASIGKILFSKTGNIQSTIYNIVQLHNQISSNKLYELMGFNVRQQVSELLRKKKIFAKKSGVHFIYSLHPFEDKVVIHEKFDISSLKQDDKTLNDLQIIKEILDCKKTDIAKKHNISVETVSNIEKRFNANGVKGLIHTRGDATIKISSAREAAIIVEMTKNPDKDAKAIKESLTELQSTPVKTVSAVMDKTKNLIGDKKKILLEIQ
jgi:transposase